MSTKHIIAYALILAGGIGAFNRYQASSPSTSPTTGIAAYTGTFDPAAMVGLVTTDKTFDTGMIVDLGLVGIGVWLLMK